MAKLHAAAGSPWHTLLQYSVLALGLIGVSFALTLAVGAHAGMGLELDRIVASVGADRLRLETLPENRNGFSESDLQAILELPYVVTVSADTPEYLLSNPREQYMLTYVGVAPSYFLTRNIPLASGRVFQEADGDVAILGYEVGVALFDTDAVGRVLDTGTRQYTVIGTLEYVPTHDRRTDKELNTAVFVPVQVLADRMKRTHVPFDMIWIHVEESWISEGIAELSKMFAGRGRVREMADVYRLAVADREVVSRFLDVSVVLFLTLSGALFIVIGRDIAHRGARYNGLRRALGASRAHILTAAFRWFGTLAILASGAGVALAAIAMPTMERYLGLPLRFGAIHAVGAVILLAYVAGVSLYLANRSASVPPLRAIREANQRGRLHFVVEYALTVSSLALGLGAVLFLVAFSDYTRSAWTEALRANDPGVLSVRTTPLADSLSFLPQYILSVEDARGIAGIEGVSGVLGEVRARCLCKGPSSSMTTTVLGLYSIGLAAPPGELQEGRLPMENEILGGAPVALIGPSVAQRLFDDANPIGQPLDVDGIECSIIGVFRPTVPSSRPTIQAGDTIVIPWSAFPSLRGEHILWARLSPFDDPATTTESIAQWLHEQHPRHAPAIVESTIGRFGTLLALMARLVTGFMVLAVLALLTSIGGVFSLSWNRVLDAWCTLGIRRALGQPRWQTFLAALRPAIYTALSSGFLGFAISLLALRDLAATWDVPLSIRPIWFLWASIVVLAAAVLGGGIPALWAARLVPADTIRMGKE